MRIEIKLIAFSIIIFCISACSMLDYHPYSGHIDGETGLTASNLAQIARLSPTKTNFRFAFISDTQGAFDETRQAVKAINSRGDIDFVLHGGDLTDFALPSEFRLMCDELQRLDMPWLSAIGNHDCLANGKQLYNIILGCENYSFTVGQTHFLVLNTNAKEFDCVNVPDMDFIGEEAAWVERRNALANEGACLPITQTVVLMHSHPGDDQFNEAATAQFGAALSRFPGLVCLSGHIHSTTTLDCLGNGTAFHIVAAIKKRQMLVFTFNNDSYEKEVVSF